MQKFVVGLAAMAIALSLSSAADAAIFTPGSSHFTTSVDAATGTVTADLGNSGIAKGIFSDTFQFTLDENGVGSGSLSTSTAKLGSATDLDFTSVLINGVSATLSKAANGMFEFAYASGIPIKSGVLNTIVVKGLSRGNGSYGGNATFSPVTSVPEAGTWAMMFLGFGVVGGAMRSRRKTAVNYRDGKAMVTYA